MRRFPLLLAPLLVLFAAPRPAEIPFEKITLDLGANETAAIADLNNDGKPDIVSGENWYQAPTWRKHPFRQILFENSYVDVFSDLPLDVDGDRYTDIVSCTWFQRKLAWWRNPGPKGGVWQETSIESGAPIEFCFLVDLDNDGKAREVLPQFGNPKAPLKWYEVKDGRFVAHTVSAASYGHGIGAGDINRDGRTDILTPQGWLEAPADPRSPGWVMHSDWKLESTGFMYVADINGDGRNDVLTSMAHDYGIFWLEQPAQPGEWKKAIIDDSWSQSHAMTVVDLNGDGLPDLLTGKRYMAHNGKDPGEKEPLGVYWYERWKDAPPEKPAWVRHVIDYSTRAGGGMQLPVADLDGDGDLDFVAPGKAGLFLFLNRTK